MTAIELVMAGSVGPIVIVAVQQLGEYSRQFRQRQEDRLSELIDRVSSERQYIRTGGVFGLADLILSCRSKADAVIARRAIRQVAVMLHVEEDGAVQEALVACTDQLCSKLRSTELLSLFDGELVLAIRCVRRWLVGGTAYVESAIGRDAFKHGKVLIENHISEYYGLSRDVLDEIINEGHARGTVEWDDFRFDHDFKKREQVNSVNSLANLMYRYQCCLRALRLVRSAMPESRVYVEHGWISALRDPDEAHYKGGMISFSADVVIGDAERAKHLSDDAMTAPPTGR
jgi:hypothetical protein